MEGYLMFKEASLVRRIFAPCVLAICLVLLVAPAALAASSAHGGKHSLVGPKNYYLALGDSLAFGFQPDLNFDHGYADDFAANLSNHGVKHYANMGCPGETSITMINGNCPYPFLRKYPYVGSQLTAAVKFIQSHAGQVSPVTLDIGANDLLPDINTNNCSVNVDKFNSDLATLDNNLTQTILPEIHNALVVNGQVSGDFVLMNYYDPNQNICPNSVPYTQELNQHLANDASGFGVLVVDVFTAFGGATTPNKHICSYTWMCSIFQDIHATNKGYSVIATTFEKGVGY